jgi:hypothetical protein
VALATYLSALGLDVKPETVAQYLMLVPIVALELWQRIGWFTCFSSQDR